MDTWLEREGVGYVIEVVSRPAGAKGFVLLHRLWVVERTPAWIGRNRRHGRDYEWSIESSGEMIKVCSIHRKLRFLRPDASSKQALSIPRTTASYSRIDCEF